MASLWTTGPAHMFTVLSPTSTTPVYVGTAETKPDIEVTPAWTEVKNDIAGQSLPLDRMYDGMEGMVSAIMTRWNYPVLLAMQARPNIAVAGAGGLGGAEGVNFQLDVGTMMSTEGFTYPFWVWFPKAALAAYAGMPAGYRFWSTFLIGPDKIEPGTRAKKQALVVKAQRAFTPSNSPAQSVPGGMVPGGPTAVFRLFDHNMTGISSALLN